MAEKYYRVTFDSKGIYNELKNAVGFGWKNLKNDPGISWLPVPDVKYGKHTSYFTEKGYSEFQRRVLPLIGKYLDPNKIEIKEFDNPKGKIVYKDQYQVVTENSYTDYLSVYNSLPDSERQLVSPRGKFVNSPALIFRYNHMELHNNHPESA